MISVLVGLLFLAALIFIFVPILPPGLFVLAGYWLYAHHTEYQIFNSLVLIIVGFFCILSFFIDNVLTFVGAKVFRASKLSIIGMMIGMIVGFVFGSFIGLLIGVFVGSFLGEFVNSTLINKSLMVALGAIAGYFLGVLLKFFVIGGLIFYFILKVFVLKS